MEYFQNCLFELMMAAKEKELYCVCKSEYQPDQFMIECDKCKDWFHGRCIGIAENQAQDIDIYHCPSCEKAHGPLTLKRKRLTHRHNYKELIHGFKTIFTGTVDFIKLLKARKFTDPSGNMVILESGYFLSTEYLEANGFSDPILVRNAEGLGLTLPPSNFTVYDVEQSVGSMQEIHVIDVAKQEDMRMKMREWTEYYNCPIRTKVLNVISLEFSKTKLAPMVSPPAVVRDISWVENVWPEDLSDDSPHSMPFVQKYCLMGVKDCYTDFHVDFGGTSVWYHVFRGEKVFYLIEPTDENLAKYENWVSSSNQSQIFFGDRVSRCIRCSVKQGQTLFIPTGWIHAVMTPMDTLVFGGNFLHSLNIGLQFKIYDLEQRLNTPIKFLFPNYETTCWFAAKAMLKKLKGNHREDSKIPSFLLKGISELVRYLRNWTFNKEDFLKFHQFQVPDEMNHMKLIKALEKELKNDMMMEIKNVSEMMKVPSIVMTDNKTGKGNQGAKKSSKTVIKLKLTGPNPNIKDAKKPKKLKKASTKQENTKKKRSKDSNIVGDGSSKGSKNARKKIKKRREKQNVDGKIKESEANVSQDKIRSDSMQIQVANGKIKSDSGETSISGNKFKPLVGSDPREFLQGNVSSLATLEDQDWEAAQLLSNFHGMDTHLMSNQMTSSAMNTSMERTSQPVAGLNDMPNEQKPRRDSIFDQIDAVKNDLFANGSNRPSAPGRISKSFNSDEEYGTDDRDDGYMITKPLAKPKGGVKRTRSDTDSDYDPEEEYYQDANYVYPRLRTNSDLDYDDFAWNPGQRSKRKSKKTLVPQSKLNSQIAHGGHVSVFDDMLEGTSKNKQAKDKPQGTEKKKEKTRKGSTTAKQRLGKLLKLDKLGGRYVR